MKGLLTDRPRVGYAGNGARAWGWLPPPGCSGRGPAYSVWERRWAVAIQVVITPETEDPPSIAVATLAALLEQLKPTEISVDASCGGRVVLAALQARGLPAHALEKRPRPTLPEVAQAEAASREAIALKAELEETKRELRHLREYREHIGKLIERLD